ncbi:MAG: GspH/FimT family pseudopilin [Burkholderiales bacterium]
MAWHPSHRKHPSPPAGNRAVRGFTALELLVAIAIVAILMGIGVPSLRDTIASQRVRAAANDLFSDLMFARAEAIKRNAQVRLVRGSTSWSEGWTVMAAGTALRAKPRLSDVAFAGAVIDNVTYNADGRTTLGATASFNFSAAADGAISMRCVVITPSGRPAVLVDGNRNGNCQDG